MKKKLLVILLLFDIAFCHCQESICDKLFIEDAIGCNVILDPIDCDFIVNSKFDDTLNFKFIWIFGKDSITNSQTRIDSVLLPGALRIESKKYCCYAVTGINFNSFIDYSIEYPEENCKNNKLKFIGFDTNHFQLLLYKDRFFKDGPIKMTSNVEAVDLKNNKFYYYKLASRQSFCNFSDSIYIDGLYREMKFIKAKIITDGCKENAASIILDSTSIEGGSPPYSYYWSNNSVQTSLNNIDIGYYSLEITDENNCALEHSFKVTPEIELVELKKLEHYSKVKNQGGKIELLCKTLNGEKPVIDWLPPIPTTNHEFSIKNLNPGEYCAFITYEKNKCSFDVCYTILEE
jgi:hypothetical protein